MVTSRIKIAAILAIFLSTACLADARATTEEPFGERIARTLQDGQGDQFTAFLDKDGLIDRAIEGLPGNESFMTGLRSGFRQALDRVGTVMVNNLGPDVKLTHVRTRTVDGIDRALVRIDMGERGLNYMDFLIAKRDDGSWSIVDWLDYAQGQAYTGSLRLVIALMMRDQPSFMSRLLGMPEVDADLARSIGEMGAAGQRGDWTGWLEIYRTLPEEVRMNRVFLVTRMAAANVLGDRDEYMSTMADLREHHGDDPTLSLALIDYYILTGDPDRAYAAVDRLDEYTGGDAALTNFRAGIALHTGDNAASIRYARQAIEQDPDYEDTYWQLMLAGTRAADYRAAMEGVRGLERRFGYALSEDELMESEEDFSGLVASKEWRTGD
jgi:hypothetical protein